MARAHLADVSFTRWYHCITFCVKHSFLFAEGPRNRKNWIEHRPQELAEIFAASVGGYSVMDNRLRVLVGLDPDTATGWADEEIRAALVPALPVSRQITSAVTSVQGLGRMAPNDAQWVANARERLQSVSWFMKCMKERLAWLANRQNQARGAFFEQRCGNHG